MPKKSREGVIKKKKKKKKKKLTEIPKTPESPLKTPETILLRSLMFAIFNVYIISALNLCNRHDGQTHQSMPTEVIAVKTRKSKRFYDFVELNGLSFLGIQVYRI